MSKRRNKKKEKISRFSLRFIKKRLLMYESTNKNLNCKNIKRKIRKKVFTAV